MRKIKTHIVRSLVPLGLLLLLLTRLNYTQVHIKTINLLSLPFIVLSVLITYLLRSLFYEKTLDIKSLSLPVLFNLTGVYNFISSVLPFGIGHLSYPYFLKKYFKTRIYNSVSSLFIYNLFRGVFFLLLFFFSFYFISTQFDISFPWISLRLNTILITFLFVALLIIVLGKTEKLKKYAIYRKLKSFILVIADSFYELTSISHVLYLTVFTIAIIGLNILTVYFSYSFLGYSLTFRVLLLLVSVVNLSNLLPIHSIGRLGSYEAISTAVLMLSGFSANEAIQVSFAVHFINILLQAVIALPCYIFMKKIQNT